MQPDVSLLRQLAEHFNGVHHTERQARRRADEQDRIRCDRGAILQHVNLKLVIKRYAHELEAEVVGRLPEGGVRRYGHHHLGRANARMMDPGAIAGGFHAHEDAFRPARRDAAYRFAAMQQVRRHADHVCFELRETGKQ